MALERVGEGSQGPNLGLTSGIQGAHRVDVNNSTFNVVGGDSHTHHHYHSANKDLQAILNAISNFRKIQQDTLAKATPGTIVWLLECEEFRLFIDVDGVLKILWGSGMPGAGKTILASIVIERLEALARASNGGICVGYVYIRYSDQGQVTLRSILETLVKQTVERHPDCMPLCEEVYRQHLREGTRPTEEELVALLRLFNSKRKLTFYVLDALDEAPVRLRFKLVQKLSALGARLFITSRPLQDLEAHFPDIYTFSIHAHDQDLDLHIAQKISESHDLQDLINKNEPAFKDSLISSVKASCGGMFLHATLQLDALQDCFTAHDAIETLETFPSKIEEVYNQTWTRVADPNSPRQKFLAITAFAWVLYAKQSLTIEQLRRALATSPQTYQYESKKIMSDATIFAACRGLIVADRESNLIRLVHYTAKAPLEALLLQELPRPHSLLTAVCITRLSDCKFQHSSIRDKDELHQILDHDPLLSYAYGAWAFHVSKSLAVDKTTNSLATRFIAGCTAFPAPDLHLSSVVDFFTPLHIVTFYDLPINLAGPAAIQNPNILTARWHTSLHFACIHSCEAVAKSLLSLPGVLVNLKDCYGYTPLMLACGQGHKNIAELLLARQDIDVNAVKNVPFSRDTALTFASSSGHVNIVQLLLTHPNIDANAGSPNALLGALISGRPVIARLLLDVPGIDIHQVYDDGDTAIRLAAQYGYEDIVRRLLEFPGIRIDEGIWGCHSAISLAQENGHTGIVKLLRDFEATTAAAAAAAAY